MLILPCAQSCFIQKSIDATVPTKIKPGYKVAKVDLTDCYYEQFHLISKDPSFTVRSDGAIVAVAEVSVTTRGRTFSVLAEDNTGRESELEVHLAIAPQKKERTGILKRTKRRWSPPPLEIPENDLGPFPKAVETIRSDSEAKEPVYYEISGPGVDQGFFTLDRETGILYVHQTIDREKIPKFIVIVSAFSRRTNQQSDQPLDLAINVLDKNDNAPEFKDSLQFTVLEQSNPGTVVGQVNGTDKDEENTFRTKIKYTLLSGTDLFAIHPETGVITTVTNTLDREDKEKQLVIVQLQDMFGASDGLSTTGTATITVGDINDNPPTFTKTSYEASVPENESEKLILRIPVVDRDLINTPNWVSKFVITKGNENGNFRIDTDPKTNDGLLYVSKPLDYEKTKSIKLDVMARNVAELTGTTAQWSSIPVNVNVIDVDEGPEFTAPTIRFIVKENVPNNTLIGTYTASDPETKSSDGIKYYKVTDPASWISVDKNTGELRVANTIDRESNFVQDGIYNITMKAVDSTSKTGMGKVILQVEDENDNIPVVPISDLVICETQGKFGSVLVVAEDKDQPPFSAPFTFSLPTDKDGKWSVTRLNDTTATLNQIQDLPTGIYSVPVVIKDLQGFGDKQTVKVRICNCVNGVCKDRPSSISLGPLALLAMLLPLALLLLLCILLAFFCRTKGDKIELEDAGDGGGILLKSNTEGRGEEVDPTLITVLPFEKNTGLNSGWQDTKNMTGLGGHSVQENGMYKSGVDMQDFFSSHHGSHYDQLTGHGGGGGGMGFDSRHLVQDSSFFHTWQTNGLYLQQKLPYLGGEHDGRYADDIIHSYGFEGVGSAAGSVGCCSDFGDNDSLEFLNTLGPKFKTLADVCTKK